MPPIMTIPRPCIISEPCPIAIDQGNHGKHRGKSGYENGTQPVPACINQGCVQIHAFAVLIGCIHKQDAVVYHRTDQDQETKQRHHADGRAGQVQESEGADQAEGDTGHNHNRVLKGFKLDCHNQKYQQYGRNQ